VRLVWLNAWGGAVWPALGDWIEALAPDVLFLQEVIRAPVPSPEWLIYEDAHRRLDQRGDLFADVSARLPQHQAFFAPAARGPLTDEQGRRYTSEHGLGVWVARGLAVSDYATRFVTGRFRPDGWGPEPVSRTMQMMRLQGEGLGAGLVAAQLHGLRDPGGKGDTPARERQAHAIAGALSDFADPGEPLVLGGDFNLLPQSATFERLGSLGLSDLVTVSGIEDTRTTLYTKPQRHANYLLVRKTVRVSAFAVPDAPVVSDHRPLILDLAA
jgi:endonuclease/exonuclease/phosphatase family metal-dependent hydrolase